MANGQRRADSMAKTATESATRGVSGSFALELANPWTTPVRRTNIAPDGLARFWLLTARMPFCLARFPTGTEPLPRSWGVNVATTGLAGLRTDLDVGGRCGGLGNRQVVLLQAPDVQVDGLVHARPRFLGGSARGYAAGQVRRVGREGSASPAMMVTREPSTLDALVRNDRAALDASREHSHGSKRPRSA